MNDENSSGKIEEFQDGLVDTRFLEVCIDGDVEDLVALFEEIARNGETLGHEDLNCADNSGRTAVSYLCSNGMIEMLEVLEDVSELDYNIPDNEGTTPLHYAAQAGHVEVVSFLLTKVRTIQVDPINHQGFSPLMKAALQGRIKCSKLLLFSGASPVRRDFGRGFTASQWARYCGRYTCAESIEKFVRTAVPGGASLISDSSGTGTRCDSISSLGKKSKKAGHHSRSIHRARSVGATAKSGVSWLTKTLQKAFATSSKNSTKDREYYQSPDASEHFKPQKKSIKSRQKKSFSFRSHSSRNSSKMDESMVIPHVEVTLSCAISEIKLDDDADVLIASGEQNRRKSSVERNKKSGSILSKKW